MECYFYIDKYLISKYFKGLETGVLVLFSTIAGLFVLPFILIFNPDVLSIGIANGLLITSISLISLIQLYLYFYALKKDEASVIVPLFQTIPLFSYILGYFVLGEQLTLKQILSGLLIMFGAIALTIDIDKKTIKLSVLGIMSLASFLVALVSLLFKFVAIQGDFLTTAFWAYFGDALVGVFIFIFIKKYRQQFLSVFKQNKIPVISVNVLNEVLNVVASMCIRFATLLAPLALVWVVNGFQPFFVFLYGLILTIFFPHLGSESLLKRHLIQKVISIIIMFIGTYFLNS